MKTIDMTPSWAEFTSIYIALSNSGQTHAVELMTPDLKRMAAMACAFADIYPTLTQEQFDIAKASLDRAAANQQ